MFRCTERDENGKALLVPERSAKLISLHKETYPSGAEYEIFTDQLHRVSTQPKEETITLVKQLKKQRNFSYVAKERKSDNSLTQLRNPPLERDEAEKKLELCYSVISRYLRSKHART